MMEKKVCIRFFFYDTEAGDDHFSEHNLYNNNVNFLVKAGIVERICLHVKYP